jgi:membrane protein DedA with SNARE-associated domain
METSSTIATLLSFGFVGIGCLAVIEKFIPLFPSYVLLMFLGMTVSDGATLTMTIMVTTVGSVIGAVGWYGLGRALGSHRIENLVARYGKYIFFRPSLYGRLTNAYRSNHFWVTLIGQTLPTVRIYLALPAGVLKLEPRAFLAATSLGTLIWNMPFLSLGYALRGSGHDPVSISFWVAVVLIAAEFAILLGFRFCKRPVAHSPGITAGERNGGI